MNDIVGYVVAYVAFKISERSDSPKELSFGWQRASLLGAFFNGVFLLALGVSILLQSIERFVSLQHVENPMLVLIVGCVGLVLNIISATFLHEHQHNHGPPADQGAELRDNTARPHPANKHDTHRHETRPEIQRNTKNQGHDLGLMGVLLHVIGDAANNVGVIIAAAVIWKAKYNARYYADPAVSMAIAFMILLSSLPLVKKSGTILMESVPVGVDPNDVKHDLETIAGVVAVHELHIWRLNQQKAIASAHIVVSNDTMIDFMELANTINHCFHAYGIHSATLQPETVSATIGGRIAPGLQLEEAPSVVRRRVVSEPACQIGCRTTSCENLACCD
ncbi:hypothetical protein LTR41_002453 [Exophiala xenobiotica]|nr:hypothetical protein LTR41_002453 [Exophiala xenobiotica]